MGRIYTVHKNWVTLRGRKQCIYMEHIFFYLKIFYTFNWPTILQWLFFSLFICIFYIFFSAAIVGFNFNLLHFRFSLQFFYTPASESKKLEKKIKENRNIFILHPYGVWNKTEFFIKFFQFFFFFALFVCQPVFLASIFINVFA